MDDEDWEMTNPFELPRGLLHEVIIRTIEMDNLSNKIIRTAFGLDLDFGGKDNCMVLNAKEIYRFNEFFLDNLGSSSRAELLLKIVNDMIKNKKGFKPCKNFKNKLIDFYKIRNIFAHNLYPKDLQGITHLDSSTSHWIELNKQHKDLYEELKEFLMSNCFSKNSV